MYIFPHAIGDNCVRGLSVYIYIYKIFICTQNYLQISKPKNNESLKWLNVDTTTATPTTKMPRNHERVRDSLSW